MRPEQYLAELMAVARYISKFSAIPQDLMSGHLNSTALYNVTISLSPWEIPIALAY